MHHVVHIDFALTVFSDVQIFIHIDENSPHPNLFFSRLNSPSSCSLFSPLTLNSAQSPQWHHSITSVALYCTLIPQLHVSLELESPKLDSRCGLTSVEQTGGIMSLQLLTTVILQQPRIQFTFLVIGPTAKVLL